MTFKAIKDSAKEAVNGRRGTFIGAFLLYLVVAFGVGVLSGLLGFFFLGYDFAVYHVANQVISALLSFFVIAPLAIGLPWLALDIYDRRDAKAKNVFDVFSVSYKKVVLANFLVGLYTFLWSLLFIIPGIIKAFSYSQVFEVLKDNPELTASQAIKKSQRLMQGNKWRFFVFNLSFILWFLPVAILAPLAFLVLFNEAVALSIVLSLISIAYNLFFIIYFAPYFHTAIAGFYRQLTQPKEPVE